PQLLALVRTSRPTRRVFPTTSLHAIMIMPMYSPKPRQIYFLPIIHMTIVLNLNPLQRSHSDQSIDCQKPNSLHCATLSMNSLPKDSFDHPSCQQGPPIRVHLNSKDQPMIQQAEL